MPPLKPGVYAHNACEELTYPWWHPMSLAKGLTSQAEPSPTIWVCDRHELTALLASLGALSLVQRREIRETLKQFESPTHATYEIPMTNPIEGYTPGEIAGHILKEKLPDLWQQMNTGNNGGSITIEGGNHNLGFHGKPPAINWGEQEPPTLENLKQTLHELKLQTGTHMHAVLPSAGMEIKEQRHDPVAQLRAYEALTGLNPMAFDEVTFPMMVTPPPQPKLALSPQPEPKKKRKSPKVMPEHHEVVSWFAETMETELAANEREKEGRRAWLDMDETEHLYQLLYHTRKLTWALAVGNIGQLLEYTADVANHSMFLADAAREGRLAMLVPVPTDVQEAVADPEAGYADEQTAEHSKASCRALAEAWIAAAMTEQEEEDDASYHTPDQD